MGYETNDEYAFPCTIIRGDEKTLLNQAALDRVLEAKTMEQAMSVLSEFGYGSKTAYEKPRDFEQILRDEMDRVHELVYEIAPDQKETELFLYPVDYHNMKVLIKAEQLKIDPTPFLVGAGTLSPDFLEEKLKRRCTNAMSVVFQQKVPDAWEALARSGDSQEIDIILDKACYRDMLDCAEATENDYLIGYVKLQIDLINVNSLIRIRQIGKPRNFYERVFIDGGNIGRNILVDGYEEAYSQLADKLSRYGMGELITKGAAALKEDGNYTVLAKMIDDMTLDYAKDAHFICFGIEPIVGYIIAKENEIKNLRMILTGKIAGTNPEIIAERMRKPYV